MKEEQLQKALTFTQSEVWDSVMHIIDLTIEIEVNNAIDQEISDEKRAHQCGRADGIKFLKNLLIETHKECKDRAGIVS